MDQRNFEFMFYGFAAAWAVLALYALTLVVRENKLKKDVETLRRMVERKET